ncbi:MAG: hypothetical protein LBJ59_02705 [Zoogloeaceae bacterium]|jgi:hypothetical protein|nr:hypothetical protein [Zoogloeaceae bacterium]
MISIRVNDRRDLTLNKAGALELVNEAEAIGQNCVTAISAQTGEMIYAMQDGAPTLDTVWRKHSPAKFEAAARRVLLAVEGVIEVVEFHQQKNGDVLNYTATIRTIYGVDSIAGFFTD